MGCFSVKGAAHTNHNAGAGWNHERWRRRRRFGSWRRGHLLLRRLCHLLIGGGSHLLVLSGRHLLGRLLRWGHLTAGWLARLRLTGGVGRWRILALLLLATGGKTQSENCTEHER